MKILSFIIIAMLFGAIKLTEYFYVKWLSLIEECELAQEKLKAFEDANAKINVWNWFGRTLMFFFGIEGRYQQELFTPSLAECNDPMILFVNKHPILENLSNSLKEVDLKTTSGIHTKMYLCLFIASLIALWFLNQKEKVGEAVKDKFLKLQNVLGIRQDIKTKLKVEVFEKKQKNKHLTIKWFFFRQEGMFPQKKLKDFEVSQAKKMVLSLFGGDLKQKEHPYLEFFFNSFKEVCVETSGIHSKMYLCLFVTTLGALWLLIKQKEKVTEAVKDKFLKILNALRIKQDIKPMLDDKVVEKTLENQQLTILLNASEAKNKKLVEELNTAKVSLNATNIALNKALNDFGKLQGEKESHKCEFETLLKNKKKCLEDAHKKEVNKIQRELEELEIKLNEEQRYSAHAYRNCSKLQEEVQEKETQVRELETELEKERRGSRDAYHHYSQLKEEVKEKETQIIRLEMELEKKRKGLEVAYIHCSQLKEEVKAKDTKISMLETKMEKERRNLKAVNRHCSQLKEEVKEKDTQISELETELLNEQSYSNDAYRHCSQLKTEVKKRDTQIRELETELENCRNYSEDTYHLSIQLIQLKREVQKRDAQLRKLDSELENERRCSEDNYHNYIQLIEEINVKHVHEMKKLQGYAEDQAGKLAQTEMEVNILKEKLQQVLKNRDDIIGEKE